MNLRWYTRALLAAGSGAALALSFPKYNLWPLAWVALAMLILASYRSRPAASPIYGFLHGVVFYPVGLPWISVVMQQYGNIDPWTSAGILGLIAIAGGIVCSFFSLGVALASKKSRTLPFILAPCLWVTLEFARTHLPYIGFPWNLTGYAASSNIALVQLTPLTGIWGLSFLIAAYGSLLAYTILAGRHRVWKAFLVTTAALGLIALVGGYFVPRAEPTHYAHLIQTNLPPAEEQPANWLQLHAAEMDQLERISIGSIQASEIPKSVETPQAHDRLIIWPEEPAPFSMQDPAFAGRAQRIARESNSDLLVGVVETNVNAQRHQIYWTNSAVLVDPAGRQTFRYDKMHLVPFAEFVPLRNLLTFAKPLVQGIGDFTAGTKYSVGQLPDGKFGVFICYEAIFPDEIRRFTKDGAQLLINISDDGWFGRSNAPRQHLMMARVRAVESRRWLLRDTNNGFTVAFDPYGRIVASMPADERGELNAPYAFRNDITLYVRFGDWLPWLCVLASIALITVSTVNSGTGNSRLATGKHQMMTAYGRVISCVLFVLYCSSGPAFARQGQKNDQFVRDPNRPFVYLQFDHIGNGIPRDNHEPQTRIWLRLTNNCNVPIVVQANGVPEGSPKDEVGLNYKVVPNRRISPQLFLSSPDGDSQSNPNEGRVQTDKSELPRGYMEEVSSSLTIDPGHAVLFSMPVNHLSKRWHIEIPFEFQLPVGKCCRDPNKWGGEPQMVVSYGLWDLPTHTRLAR